MMTAPNGSFYLRPATCQTVKMREEKEILEHFAGVVKSLKLNTKFFKKNTISVHNDEFDDFQRSLRPND